ncbi:MAG: zinc-ribbon domain containing protein [candidate division Zixibacteria bacterium]|nr:zinc-ribbon domain containing protein [candidate division Zixibacteria bacterium]
MKEGLEPKILICTECNEEFVFTSAAQQYFLERGYTEDPKRCKSCHTAFKRSERNQRKSQHATVSDSLDLDFNR